jgi:hypothetical protein
MLGTWPYLSFPSALRGAGIIDPEPVPRWRRPTGGHQPLRYGAIPVGMLIEHDADGRAGQKPRQLGLALVQWWRPELHQLVSVPQQLRRRQQPHQPGDAALRELPRRRELSRHPCARRNALDAPCAATESAVARDRHDADRPLGPLTKVNLPRRCSNCEANSGHSNFSCVRWGIMRSK